MKEKFSFKTVKGSRKYLTWKKWEEGDYMIGTFKQEGKDQFGNPSYTLEVIETSLEGIEEGELFGLNSNGALNYKMEDVEINDVIRVEYQGEDILDSPKSPFNGKMFHKIDLQRAETPIDVEAIKEVQEKLEDEEYGEGL